ncbi:cation diffusion facilitator family transporter [Corynebacterium aquilae]|uniref:Cobalt-zinc-cadmium resistance protein n=1 Tax=Corynebacterium aquilae DSM 44791 TaxID=1431546 RepID=A0A1L7CFH0_9CORY|nr:cation diffusion facilitator family transporter [Corynebacterium aquilae]APT84611.1 cobalt-zinc-cadmium resistance protein [Corynebacterium aquilae DSM 44791]
MVHSHAPSSTGALLAVIALTTVIFLAEIIAGVLSGSLALLADSAHMLSDSAGLVMALVAILIGRKTATSTATFGYRRVEVLAAAINAVTVGLISVWIVVEAIMRLGHPETIDTGLMLVVAIIGLVANVGSALILARRQHDSLNMKGAYLHVLSDMLGSVAVIVAGLVIRYTGFVFADTIASLAIATLILPRTWALLRDAGRVLLEHVPQGVDAEDIQRAIEAVVGVHRVHDLHVWSVDGSQVLVTCHVVTTDTGCVAGHCALLDSIHQALREVGVSHSTIQIEGAAHQQHEDICH